jgi:ribosomal protein S26
MSKADYVRRQRQTRAHTCHWPGCTQQVPPAMWGCRRHWYMLPQHLRTRIWQTYQPGQEKGAADVSHAYVQAARAVQRWIIEHYCVDCGISLAPGGRLMYCNRCVQAHLPQ